MLQVRRTSLKYAYSLQQIGVIRRTQILSTKVLGWRVPLVPSWGEVPGMAMKPLLPPPRNKLRDAYRPSDEDGTSVRTVVTGKEVVDADLKNPFKETVKTPLTRRIIEFAGSEFKMPTNVKLYDGSTDPEDHLSRFSSAANSGDWPMPV
ncbi:hypothetical protein Tco_1035844 [Tanacetum coccineum]